MIAFTLLLALQASDLQVSPQSREELEGILAKLAETHRTEPWCPRDCQSFYEVRLDGRLDSGAVDLILSGVVHGDSRAFVPLFTTKPAGDIDALTSDSGARQPLFFSGGAYATVLPPGPFRLRGRLSFVKGAALSITLPGPVGLVSLAVPDADVVGTGERRGVRDATYQLTPRVAPGGDQKAAETRLRLQVQRRFSLDRDKTFSVTIEARGAKPGQVIRIPLLAGEHVEDLDPSVGHERKTADGRAIDWVASGPEAILQYGGRWTADRIDLVAPSGAVREAWQVRCDDPYLCTFTGDAEASPGTSGHEFSPLPGQKLAVTLEELQPLPGVHTVAQQVLIASKPVGRNLQQQLVVNWMSSSGSNVALALPEEAVVSSFALDGTAMPVLKDASGLVHVSLPAGRSQLRARYELAGAAGSFLSPPAPTLHAPLGTLYHTVHPAEGTAVLLTGGIAGSPRVVLWPSLFTCLLIALAGAYLARRVGAPLPATGLWIAAALGFAIVSPLALLPLIGSLGIGRALSRVARPRHRFRIFVELSCWVGLVLFAVGVTLATLESSLFSSQPIEVDSYITPPLQPEQWSVYNALSWATYLAGLSQVPLELPRPYVVVAPLILVRLLWAAWAVALAVWVLREGRLALGQLGAYWAKAGWKDRAQKPMKA